MFTLPPTEFKKITSIVSRLSQDYTNNWLDVHKKLADYVLPVRYSWLDMNPSASGAEQSKKVSMLNSRILDSTGTKAARDLAAGLLNGITSPARPWFNLRAGGFPSIDAVPLELQRWVETVRERMMLGMAESNFYNAMGNLFLELGVFGISGMAIYEDDRDIFRCYNYAMGEFYVAQDERRVISTLARIETMTVEQLVNEFGEENVTAATLARYKKHDGDLFFPVKVYHLVEPNRRDSRYVPGGFAFREFFWECTSNPRSQLLRIAGFSEQPFGFPRWETLGTMDYGLSPAMDALGDIIQLQHETLRKGESIDKMTDPPILLDSTMRSQRGSANPGSKFYVSGHSQATGRALYDVRMPLAELSADIAEVQQRIRDAFFNDLFRMISQLDTVRSATEIDARREEKLILMGAVLERLENEALDPFITRIYRIMQRRGLFPPPPPGFEDVEIEVQYVSILSDAQRAVGTGVIERFMQVVANTAALRPEVGDLPDWVGLLREYAQRLNVPPKGIRSEKEMAQIAAANAQMQQAQQAALVGERLTSAARNLGGIEVGGGQNAFQALMGGL